MNILLGISGGIAAYKCPELVRRIKDQGADVRVVLSTGARQFVTPVALQAVSGHPVRSDLWDESAEAAMSHIELARWADRILIAPATANCIAALAGGHAHDLLTTVCLASEAPVSVAPAMNRQMWAHAATEANVATLAARGVDIIGPGSGDQACGEVGAGRMLEPLEIAQSITFKAPRLFSGEVVAITAGPTREPLDPVRYLTNRSSGKMGYAMAQAFAEAGASVRLISGPVALTPPPGCELIKADTANEMLSESLNAVRGAAIFVGAAAIADYVPTEVSRQKMKKDGDTLQLNLVKAPDTLASVAALESRPFCVGFAAETNDVETYARGKLQRKKLDMIIANRVGGGLAFDTDDNEVAAYWADGNQKFERTNKLVLARQLVALIAARAGLTDNNKVASIKGRSA